MEFHERLQALRKQKGLTQEQLACALHVSRTAVSRWESGRGYPNIDSLQDMAAFFCVTVDQLLSGEAAQTAAETAQDKAEDAQTASESAQAAAETAEGDAEAWAIGKRGGVDVPSTDPAYHNNSKYWADVAGSIVPDLQLVIVDGALCQIITTT